MTGPLLDDVARYYGQRLHEHGPVAKGVDWNGEDSQALRFRQLLGTMATGQTATSVNDFGCGYGALLDELDALHPGTDYVGYDIVPEMVERALERYRTRPATRFVVASRPDRVADYTF